MLSAQLTPKQITVLEALLSGSSTSAAADAAGVHRSTVHVWRMQPQFRSFYDIALRARAEAIREDVASFSQSAIAFSSASSKTSLSQPPCVSRPRSRC